MAAAEAVVTDANSDALDEDTKLDIRAATQYLTVLEDQGRVRGRDGQYLVVSQSGSQYLVDARFGSCECRDYEYRGDSRPCKHIRRVKFATGNEPIPAIVDPDAVDAQLGEHVDGEVRWA